MSEDLKKAIEANDAEATRAATQKVKNWFRELPNARPPVPYACERGANRALEVLLEAGAPFARLCRSSKPWSKRAPT